MHVVERQARFAPDAQLHAVALLDAKMLSLRGIHVHVNCGTNYAFLQFDNAFGPDDDGARRAVNVSGKADGNVTDAEHNGVCECELDLGALANGPQNAKV